MDARSSACSTSFLECAGCSILLNEYTFANADDEQVRFVHQGSNVQLVFTGYENPTVQLLVGTTAHVDKFISREVFDEIRDWTRESFESAKKVRRRK